MERLVADAATMTDVQKELGITVDETSLSFDNIVNAISVVQKSMGIAGTTSIEATETITGSVNSAVAAFHNFLDGTGDIDNVVSTVVTAGKNISKAIVEMAPKIVDGIVQLINSIVPLLPGLIQQLLPVIVNGAMTLIQGLVNAFPAIVQALTAILPQILNTLVEMAPVILQQIISIIPVIATALAENLPTLIPVLVQGIISLMEVFNENMPLFLKAGAQIIIGLVKGLINSIPLIFENLGTIIEFIINFFTISKLIGAGKTLLTGLGKGLTQGIPDLIKKLPQLIGKIIDYFKTNGVNAFKNIGTDLIKGLWAGIKNVTGWITDKIKGFGSSILKSIKGIFGIHSPSKEFAWVGKMNVLGLEEGMESMQGDLQNTFDGMFDLSPNLYGRTSTNLSPQVNVVVNNNMELDPLGQVVNSIKTFAGGSKNDYNYGMGV